MDRRYNMPDRDDRGRFTSDDDRDYRSSRHDYDDRRSSRGRDYDDDDRRRGRDEDYSRRSQGYDHGGWYGDSEGHSEAAQRGWEGRRSDSRSYDDDRRSSQSRSSRDRDYDDDRRRSSRHDTGGWFGDYEGHSEAARKGWEGRRNDDYDDDRGRSSRYRR